MPSAAAVGCKSWLSREAGRRRARPRPRRAPLAEDHGAAGRGLGVLRAADLEVFDLCNGNFLHRAYLPDLRNFRSGGQMSAVKRMAAANSSRPLTPTMAKKTWRSGRALKKNHRQPSTPTVWQTAAAAAEIPGGKRFLPEELFEREEERARDHAEQDARKDAHDDRLDRRAAGGRGKEHVDRAGVRGHDARTMLMSPNSSPSSAPQPGPKSTAPRMTGMCRIVMDTGGTMMNPRGVKPSTASSAISSAYCTSRAVFRVVWDIVIRSLLLLPDGMQRMLYLSIAAQ